MTFSQTLMKAATSLVLIVIVALGARMAFAWSQVRKMPPQALGVVPFQNEAGNIAYALAQGKGFSNVFRMETGPTAWLAPVYPVILGAIFRVFGIFTSGAFFAAVMFNILCSAATCVPVFMIGKRFWGIGVGAGAAWLWALFPNGILIPFEWVWDTSLSAFLAAAILWATLEIAESTKFSDWGTYGLLWGVALLTNPAMGVLLPFLLGWAALRGSTAGNERWKRVALAVGAIVLCCLPWTVRNYVAFHRFIPLRSNLAFELWSGNNEVFDPDAHTGRRVMTRTEEVRRYAALGEVGFMQEKKQLVLEFVRSHPALEVRLTWRRFLNFWLGTDAPWKNFLQTDSWLIRVILAANILTAAGGLAGIAALAWKRKTRLRQRDEMDGRMEKSRQTKAPEAQPVASAPPLPLATYPLVFPLLYYVTHAYLRLRHPIDPVLMLLTAIAAAALWDATKHGPPRLGPRLIRQN